MIKVITYGTYDLLHYGHKNLLKRAKALGDYLIVGVTTENFDRARGKLLVQQSLSERIAAVKATGYADEIILEEYEGQKIDDIKKYGINIFAIGSDWKGKFDYLSEYCKVVYLPRTEGISSTQLRDNNNVVRLGIVGYDYSLHKFIDECRYVSGLEVTACFFASDDVRMPELAEDITICKNYSELLNLTDAIYVTVAPVQRVKYIRTALEKGKHVLTESPMAMRESEIKELYQMADEHQVVLCEALKTAYSLAFQRMVLLLKGGAIGTIKSLDATCTSLQAKPPWHDLYQDGGGALTTWGPTVLLAAKKILGENYSKLEFYAYKDEKTEVDLYTRISLVYKSAEASLKVGTGVKSEGSLIVSGTKGYVYVPAPWWKMDYFEVRKEDSRENKRYFFQFEGEGIRYELADFIQCIRGKKTIVPMSVSESMFISKIIEKFVADSAFMH